MRDKRERCTGCGTRREEWEADRYAYVGDQDICPGCELLEEERKNVAEGAVGVHIRLVPKAVGVERVLQGKGIG